MRIGSNTQRLSLLALAVLVALSVSSAGAQAPTTKTLWVAHYRADCVGVLPQRCLLVKEEQYSPWQLFYGRIEGFDYVEGYGYELRVVEEKIDNPPADGSAIRVKLVEIIGRYDSMDAPAEPVPMPIMIGTRPIMVVMTVIVLGRIRSTAPSWIAALRSARLFIRPSAFRRS